MATIATTDSRAGAHLPTIVLLFLVTGDKLRQCSDEKNLLK
jgi:hypothetical protein